MNLNNMKKLMMGIFLSGILLFPCAYADYGKDILLMNSIIPGRGQEPIRVTEKAKLPKEIPDSALTLMKYASYLEYDFSLRQIVIVSFIIYFLPSAIVMLNRKKKIKIPVIFVNVFLGWTFFGWWIALFMAFKKDNLNEDKNNQHIIWI